MLLKDAKIGRTYTVKSIHLPFQLERRLEALGMTRQTAISVLNRKRKGILIIKLRGTRFALGYNITKNITVEVEHRLQEIQRGAHRSDGCIGKAHSYLHHRL